MKVSPRFYARLGLPVLLASVLSARAATPVPLPAEPDAAARELVGLMANGDFAGAVARFDATMKAVLPSDKLQATWQTLLGQVGPFGKILRTTTSEQQSYKIVLVTCQFEKAAIDARVVLDAKGQAAGLFFAPTPLDPSVFNAAYAQAGSYEDQDFIVGTAPWTLPATLTMPLPKGNPPAPAVVLVHGAGPNDRDETIGANKVFRDLAWGLASRGIAVLRYEKRTRQYAANFAAPGGLDGFTVKEETLDDALAAAAALRKTPGIEARRVYVLGHSLGATVLPRIGQADPALAGLILLAGAARPLEVLVAEQTRYLAGLAGPLSKDEQAKIDALLAEVAKVKKLTPADSKSKDLVLFAPASYWLDLRAHEELAIAKSLKMPLMIAQGGRDYQVPPTDFDLWKQALAGMPDVSFKLYPNLNHLFEAGVGKSKPEEYQTAGNVDGQLVSDIADWIVRPAPPPLPH